MTFSIATAGAGATGTGTSLVVNNPLWNGSSTPAGQLLLIWGVASGATTLSCSGFSAATPSSGQNDAAVLFSLTTTGTEGSTFTVGAGTSRILGAAAIGIGGQAASPFDPTPTDSGNLLAGVGASVSYDITTTLNGDLLVWFGLSRVPSGTPATITLPAGYSSRLTQTNSTGAGANVGFTIGTTVQTSAGDAGTPAGSLSPSSNGGALLVGVAAAPVVSSPPVPIVSPSAAVMQAANW